MYDLYVRSAKMHHVQTSKGIKRADKSFERTQLGMIWLRKRGSPQRFATRLGLFINPVGLLYVKERVSEAKKGWELPMQTLLIGLYISSGITPKRSFVPEAESGRFISVKFRNFFQLLYS